MGTCDNRRSIRRGVLEGLILDALKTRLMAPDLVAELQRASLQSELATVSRRLDGLVDAISESLRAADLQQRLDELEARKAELEAKLVAPAPTPVRLHTNLAQLYREKIAELHTALADPSLHTEALGLIRGLIERVEVHPAEGGSTLN
jgi:hypothetical protein